MMREGFNGLDSDPSGMTSCADGDAGTHAMLDA
jgi:hypothetical protein